MNETQGRDINVTEFRINADSIIRLYYIIKTGRLVIDQDQINPCHGYSERSQQ